MIVINQELKDRIINSIDPYDFCAYFNIEIPPCFSKQVRAVCPIHGGDNANAFSIDFFDEQNSKCFVWRCRTGCDEVGDVFSFIQRMNDLSFKESVEWLCKYLGIEIGEDSLVELDGSESVVRLSLIHI